jgi:hypothetical protein
MITNKGQALLTKYLIGQAPAYASYIGVGCGPTPYSQSHSVTSSEISLQRLKEDLDFEMFRVPITSRGYVTEVSGTATITGASVSGTSVTYTANNNFVAGDTVTISGITPAQFNIHEGIIVSATSTSFSITNAITGSYSSGGLAKTYYTNIVLTAELPTEERYEISELGLFSSQANPDAGSKGSRTLYSFSQSENWQLHGSAVEKIPVVYTPLDAGNQANQIDGTYFVDNVSKDCKVFHTNADNAVFSNSARIARYETPRFLNNAIAIRGNLSDLGYTAGRLVYNSGSHIHLNGVSLNLDKNSPSDEIRLAFSIANRRGAENEHPSAVRILITFSSVDATSGGESASFEVNLTSSDVTFSANRYFVISKKISELHASSGFSWARVQNVTAHVTTLDSTGAVSDKFYVLLDALRLENTTVVNPLYGMSGYAIAKTTGAATIKKLANTTSYVEFRFGVDV